MKIQKEITTNKLLKYLKGELGQQEARMIEGWASESEENEKMLVSLAKVYNLSKLARTYSEKEVENAWRKTCAKAGVTPRAIRPLKKQWVFWSMAAAIALLLAVNLALVLKEPEACTDKAIILTSQQGKFVKYTLPDSTVVTLNHNSTLEFPLAFNGDERRVKLNGEGYFDVARDEEKPFIVETGKEIQIKVLGTEFNLQSFSSDDIVQVALISGSVEISRNGVEDFSYIMCLDTKFDMEKASADAIRLHLWLQERNNRHGDYE